MTTSPRLYFLLPLAALAVLVSAISTSAAANEPVEVRLDDYLTEGNDWTFGRGNEFPGAQGSLDVLPPDDKGLPGLKLTVDLSGGGKYVGMGKVLPNWEIRDTVALRMKIKTSDVSSLTFRIGDASGQTHQKKDVPIKADGEWHDYAFAIGDLARGEHWGGSNDGAWHGPARDLFISITERALGAGRKGGISFKDLRAEVIAMGDLPAATYVNEGFDAPSLPPGWEKQGDVNITSSDKASGSASLQFSRDREHFDAVTSVSSPRFPVRDGRAEFSGAFKSELESPDASFNASVIVEALNGAGEVMESFKPAVVSGPSNWTTVKKSFAFPAGAMFGRITVQLNKATGRFWVDGLSLGAPEMKYVPRNPVRRVLLKTDQTGNLPLPGQPLVFTATVESALPLPANHQKIAAWATDYWGAEQSKPQDFALTLSGRTKGVFAYTARIDLQGFTPETGRYYELRTAMDSGVGDPVREGSAFAFLPEAATKAYSWREVPFSSRNWDNRLAPYFSLSDRIGIRLVGVWGSWKPEPPYQPSAPGFDQIKKLGLTMLTRTPIVDIEHHKPGYEAYTDEALRNGVAPFFEKFGKDGEIVLTLGNEPQTSGPTVERNVALYKLMYEQVKRVSPGTFVVGTSVGPAEEYFKLGFQKYSDAVDFHTYEDSNGIRKIFERYKELFAKYGGEQPIWATEMGLNAQGLSRRAVAGELIKKFSWFFSYGGQNASWFGICYPDREGRLRGTAEDAFNLFDGLYGNYSPRLDAIAYYNVVNGICIKKFVAHREYPDGLQAFLFLDRNGDNLQILWREHGAGAVRLPITCSGPVKLLRIDGTSAALEPAGGGLDLRVGEDPILLLYHGDQKELPDRMPDPLVKILTVPGSVVRGASFAVELESKGDRDITLDLPPGWKSAAPVWKGDVLSVEITAPADTEARYVPIRFRQRNGDAEAVVPVQGQVSAEIKPIVLPDGKPAVELVMRNNSVKAEKVDWSLELRQQVGPKAGLYSQTAAEPVAAYFGDASAGQVALEPGAEKAVRVPMEGVDPITSYKVRAVVTDDSGRSLTVDRFVGGFVVVPRAGEGMKLDGKLDEAGWQRTAAQKADQLRQFRHLLPSSNWSGPDDLSGEIRFLWDDKYLYVGVTVKDDVFRNEAEGVNIWSGDGLQFLIDPARSRADKSGKYDYAVGKGKSGPVAWCYLTADGKAPAGEVKEIIVTASPSARGDMTYEIAIPWSRLLPFDPKPGADLGMAVILNEDDAPKRDGFMTWFGDIQSKEVDPVGDLILGN